MYTPHIPQLKPITAKVHMPHTWAELEAMSIEQLEALCPTTPDADAVCSCVDCTACEGTGIILLGYHYSTNDPFYDPCRECRGTGTYSGDCPKCTDPLGVPYSVHGDAVLTAEEVIL